jgi:hypothetical protein
MAESKPEVVSEKKSNEQLDTGTYEVLRSRLDKAGKDLRERLEKLNVERKEVFGSIEQKLVATAKVTTENNCVPRDMISLNAHLLFGYNVHIGLRSETVLSDVFSIYQYKDHAFSNSGLDLIKDEIFESDFKELYKYYKNTFFEKFAVIGPYLHMVFRIGKNPNDFKTFKWLISGDSLKYEGNRSEHEFRFPPQYGFEWERVTRDYQRKGKHPHASILDKVFIETVGGDLTIKIEDNTDTGEGIYSELVEDKDQRLDDAEMYYADLDNIILLKIKPFKENDFRYIVYNHKIKKAQRIDAIKDSCVLLPDNHGIIFSKGYYLQTGEFKLFENEIQGLRFEKRIQSPNGEDYLYVFYNAEHGEYVLLPYNLIEQKVENLITCHGYSIFDNGELIYFYAQNDPAKHHSIQVWSTPYVGADYSPPVVPDSYLYKIGNKDIVRCMAECSEVLGLLGKNDEAYSNLYLDLVKRSTDILDSYFWIREEAVSALSVPLIDIKGTASATIEEFEKVVRIKKNTLDQVKKYTDKAKDLLGYIKRESFEDINTFVKALSDLRSLRGDIISLKDLRYVNVEDINAIEKQIAEQSEVLSNSCVQFLLEEKSLLPYHDRVKGLKAGAEKIQKVTEATKAEEEATAVSNELEMLIQIVSNLKIDDATQTTRIIDNISMVFSDINQLKAALKNKKLDLRKTESVSEFNSQIKLIDQSIVNYLDVSTSPEKCDEYLSKIMIQLEELEGKFPDFDSFIKILTEKREEIYQAFENKKVSLLEARNNRATALLGAAERILLGAKNRIAGFQTVPEINGYFASDIMMDKLRDIVKQLTEMNDTVKADDIQGRMKNLKEDALRQLKDKKELFVQGANVVKFGNFHFSVNTQPLELTMVCRQDEMFFHITGTSFFERVSDENFKNTKPFWNQLLISENQEVYKAEYLAYLIYLEALANDKFNISQLLKLDDKGLFEFVQQYMAPRYAEGYVKGVNDKDAVIILRALLTLDQSVDLLKYSSEARACAMLYWEFVVQDKDKYFINMRLKGIGSILKVFPNSKEHKDIKVLLKNGIYDFNNTSNFFNKEIAEEASQYLFEEMIRGDQFVLSSDASDIATSFAAFLKKKKMEEEFTGSLKKLEGTPLNQFELARGWVKAFVNHEQLPHVDFVDEVAVTLLSKGKEAKVIKGKTDLTLEGLVANHAVVEGGKYALHLNKYMKKLFHFTRENVPGFESYTHQKNVLLENFREELRLEDFKTNVLSSFVRNKLIDEVYLPLVGANLAKQMGVVGENKRTDQMGMLLLISPPGYGKTTLMEYIANRLGIIFMKINGPAIGHTITSVDPAEAKNGATREELEKLNLAFEMGDNVMIYLDDIQHCNPEFLQKFISLCDGQRKIEGVYKGKSRTYDFRGKKVCVVMAGNPYTESGEKFKIPDMLANRADTYNLGDIIGDKGDVFKLSYIENCLTSNKVTAQVANKSSKDIHAFVKIAETGDKAGLEFEGSYSAEETNEIVSVIKKLTVIREVVLKVNLEYIRSASQADEFRTEPAFKLQGSYRNMNKMAEKVVPVMNDQELETLIKTHYQNEVQTLTTGAEANLLKFKEIIGWITPTEQTRWDEIKATYKKNQRFKGMGGDGNQINQLLGQLASLGDGVEGIRLAIEKRGTED